MSSGPEFTVGVSKFFHVRTTISIYRDFVVQCDNQKQAEDIARALLHEQSPAGHCDVEDIVTLRNDSDRNIGIAETSHKNWEDSQNGEQLPNPEWLV